MDAKEATGSDTPGKRKLTKEELLAGKASVEETSTPTDPRIKSPDEILLRMMSQKTKNTPISQPESENESEVTIEHFHGKPTGTTTQPAPMEEQPDPLQMEAIKMDFKKMNEKYERDRARWKEYEQNVLHWKDQVMEIVQNLKLEAADAEVLKKEIEQLKELNRKKDEEILTLLDELNKNTTKKKK